jgi:putative Mg2+ transporter-C (MgtC) family protein
VVTQSEFLNAVSTDPVRILEVIVVGISFLGASTTHQREEQGRVERLTTSASIMATHTIGIPIAIDLFWVAGLDTIAILVVNWLLNSLELWVKR